MKIVSIVGARPEFIQAWPVSQALNCNHQEVLVHTGQHYDYQMSQAFFDDLGLAPPDYNLGVGSGPHGKQTGEILARLEEILLEVKPDGVVVRGDTNSTLAGILAASKMHIPTAHIEAGERSYDRSMPEEINRLVADSLADMHFCASRTAVQQLAREGITRKVAWVGDVMLDAHTFFCEKTRTRNGLFAKLGIQPVRYNLVTVHRAATTDDPRRLENILNALREMNEVVVFPVHPRTRSVLSSMNIQLGERIKLIEPVGYLDMLALEESARVIATDSGGVQREAYFFRVPCLTLRDETEWKETVATGWNQLVGTKKEAILEAWHQIQIPAAHPPIFGDGTASEQIVKLLERELQ